jgi:hypothetical protein
MTITAALVKLVVAVAFFVAAAVGVGVAVAWGSGRVVRRLAS